jgi:hypothetical protein
MSAFGGKAEIRGRKAIFARRGHKLNRGRYRLAGEFKQSKIKFPAVRLCRKAQLRVHAR